MKPLPQPTSSTFARGGSTAATSSAMSYARPTLRRRRMRLKRRLMVVVRLVTGSAQCKPDALDVFNLQLEKMPQTAPLCSTGANLFRRELMTTERSNSVALSYEEQTNGDISTARAVSPPAHGIQGHIYLRSNQVQLLTYSCRKFFGRF